MTTRDVRGGKNYGMDFLTGRLVRPIYKIRTDDLFNGPVQGYFPYQPVPMTTDIDLRFSSDLSFLDRVPWTYRVPRTAIEFSNSD